MKTKIILRSSVYFIALFIASSSFAQNSGNKKNANNLYAIIESVKNSPNGVAGSAYGTASATVSDKIARSFSKYFGDAAEQNWSLVGTDFLNRFHVDHVLTNALFDKNGNLIYTITYGTESDMPGTIRSIVKSEYYDYTITMAVNVKEYKRDIWVVYLDNENQQITVRVEDDEMEQVQKFNKSK